MNQFLTGRGSRTNNKMHIVDMECFVETEKHPYFR